MKNLLLLPDEIIHEILEYLQICEVCNKYKISKDVQNCSICKKTWCNKCNDLNKYVRLAYFEIYIPVCYKCYFKNRIKKRYLFRLLNSNV